MEFPVREKVKISKTQSACINAVYALLDRKPFRHLSVGEICTQAQTSRASFYIYYHDKYNLLEEWFAEYLTDLAAGGVKNVIGSLVYDCPHIMTNILKNADNDTINIVVDALSNLLSIQNAPLRRVAEDKLVCRFCAAGLLELIRQGEALNEGEYLSTEDYLCRLISAALAFTVPN